MCTQSLPFSVLHGYLAWLPCLTTLLGYIAWLHCLAALSAKSMSKTGVCYKSLMYVCMMCSVHCFLITKEHCLMSAWRVNAALYNHVTKHTVRHANTL